MTEISDALHVIDSVDARLVEYDWPFARERAADIAAHWAKAKAEKPAIFNGRVLMARPHRWSGGGRRLELDCFAVDYAATLAWRALGRPGDPVKNAFAMAGLQCADGAFLLAEMGAHTANAGRVYFPSGTPDMEDVKDGLVDFAGSAVRELAEETGLTTADVAVAPGWVVIEEGAYIACMKPMRLKLDADAAKRKVEAFLASESEPELAGVRIARTAEDAARLGTASFAQLYMRYALAQMLVG